MPNENIPPERLAELKRRLEERQTPELREKYNLVRQSFIGKERKGTQEVQEIIGDNDQDDFIPQFEAKLWDNECKFSIRYLSDEEGEEIVDTEADKVKWRKGREEARFYNKPQNERHESGEFEFDIVLDEYTGKHEWVFSIRTRGLRFYRQEPLTEAEKEQGARRPDWISGGYVVYHDSKKNHCLGKKNYATGKVCNIPLPVAIDAKGDEIFGTVDIDEQTQEMRVGVSDEWLKKAKYPVTIDPTFGYTTTPSTGDTSAYILDNQYGGPSQQDGRIGNTFTVGEDGTLDSVSFFMGGSNGSGTFRGFVNEEDSAASGSHDEIASAERTSVSISYSGSWQTFTLSGESITSSTDYVLNVAGDASTYTSTYDAVFPYYDDTSNRNYYQEIIAYTPREDPWTISTSVRARDYGMYVTYTAVTSPEVEQEGFAFGDDDGTESGHTLDTQDSNYTGEVGTKTLRMLLNGTGDPASKAFKLKYQKNGTGGYVNVPTSATQSSGIAFVGSETHSIAGNGAAENITLPGTPAEDDLVVVFAVSDIDSGTDASVNTSGYTNLFINSGGSPNGYIWYKKLGATPDSVVNVSPTNYSGRDTNFVVMVFRNVDTTTPIDNSYNLASSSSGMPNPPSYTTLTDDAWVIAAGFLDDDDITPTAPSGYSNLAHKSTEFGFAGATVMVATKEVETAGAEDPAAFGGSGTDAWHGVTFALRPAAGGGANNEIYISPSSNVAAGGEATTARLTAPSGKTTADFDTGRRWDDENGTDSIDITADDYTELEWVLTTQSPATTSDYFDFRVYDGDTALDTYTVTPRWTIGTADTISEAGKVAWANISQAGTVTKANIAAIGGVTT